MSPTSGDLSILAERYVNPYEFPINRCHQQVVTILASANLSAKFMFPINRCHQQVVTPGSRAAKLAAKQFPINRCHQQVVTAASKGLVAQGAWRPKARTPFLTSSARQCKPVENAGIHCAARERAAQRKYWGFGRCRGCALIGGTGKGPGLLGCSVSPPSAQGVGRKAGNSNSVSLADRPIAG